MDAVELEQTENEEAEPIISKNKLVRKLKKKIRELEEKLLQHESHPQSNVPTITIETAEEQKPPNENQVIESELYQLVVNEKEELTKVKDELEKKNKNMNSELKLFRKLVSQRNIDKEAEWDMINEKMNEVNAERDNLQSERNRLRNDLIQMASVSKDMQNVEELLKSNPEESAYVLQAESLKKANNVLQNELQELIRNEQEMKQANEKLWKEKALLQRVS